MRGAGIAKANALFRISFRNAAANSAGDNKQGRTTAAASGIIAAFHLALLVGREALHAAAQAQHQVQGGLLLDVVVAQRAPVLQLLARKDEALLVGRDALLVLDRKSVV